MSIVDGLNAQQKAAVTAGGGPVLVLAGPGSGKTRVLTHRIVYLIQEAGVAPWHIVAVTFTNKAAKEMLHRIERLMGGQPRGLTMGTFHATCARILRREIDNLAGYERDFVIFDTADQLQVVKQALRELDLDDKKFPPYKMLSGIGNAKNEVITPELYAASNYISEVTKRVYSRYQQLLQANNAMDFDDLLMNTVLLFGQQPQVLQKYQERYHHILVDEFQDTNTAQYALLQRLAAGHGNIFVVGDSDQSIYKWRGADFRNINRFRDAYPDAQMILLEQNYRSTQLILDAAKAIIRRNQNRVHKELFTEREGGEQINVRETYDEQEEADTVVATIENLMLRGYSLGDCAVMYRTNAQSRALEEAFLRAGIPYRLVGATQFYQRREIKDLLAYLRLVYNPADSVSFDRAVNTPPRGIGVKTRQDLQAWATASSRQPAEAVIRLATDPDVQHPFNGRAFSALSQFGSMLDAWVTLRDQVGVGDLMDVILEQSNYRTYIDDGTEEGQDRWANVLELRGVAVTNPSLDLGEFLEQVALVSETDNMEGELNAVTLLTLHAAKGLEFPVVFITGVEDGVLPHSRSLDDAESLDEERRLFYVGVTRAKDKVYLSHAFRRTFYGEREVAIPSRFLQDIPEELIEGGNARQRRQQTKSRASSWSWSSSIQSAPATSSWSTSSGRGTSRSQAGSGAAGGRHSRLPEANAADDFDLNARLEPQFRTGQKVRHARFGEGTVIESKLTGNDEEVTVAFPGIGIKRLAASFANLEIGD